MIIVIKEDNIVHVFKTKTYQSNLYRDTKDVYHKDNQTLIPIGDHAILGVNMRQRLLDYITPLIHTDKPLHYDLFIDLDYKLIKKTLLDEGLLSPKDIKNNMYQQEYIVYAKDNEFVVIENFERVMPSKNIYVSSSSQKFMAHLMYHETLEPKKRVIQTLLDDMEIVNSNYFPIEYMNTKDVSIEIITLKEAVCQ